MLPYRNNQVNQTVQKRKTK